MGAGRSIYKTPEYEQKLMAIYDSRLAEWPHPYESLFLATSYGTVHVVVSGPENAPLSCSSMLRTPRLRRPCLALNSLSTP